MTTRLMMSPQNELGNIGVYANWLYSVRWVYVACVIGDSSLNALCDQYVRYDRCLCLAWREGFYVARTNCSDRIHSGLLQFVWGRNLLIIMCVLAILNMYVVVVVLFCRNACVRFCDFNWCLYSNQRGRTFRIDVHGITTWSMMVHFCDRSSVCVYMQP